MPGDRLFAKRLSWPKAHKPMQRKKIGSGAWGSAAALPATALRGLAEQLEHVAVGLGRQRERRRRQRLLSLQRQQVGAFLVGVGGRQGARTALQRVDRRLGEVRAYLHGRQARAQCRSLRLQRGQGGGQRGRGGGDIGGGGPTVGRSHNAETEAGVVNAVHRRE